MRFRTEIENRPLPFGIGIDDKGVLLGSCFSDEIGAMMRGTLWDVAVNPCGTLFNPESIERVVRLALKGGEPRFAEHGGVCHCMEMSSAFSSASAEECVKRSREALACLGRALAECGFLVLTFGTAWVFRMDGVTVGNCHKMPKQIFERVRLTADEVAAAASSVISLVREINPSAKVIFTVSPVRHTADTLHGNTLSKAVLHLGIEAAVGRNENALYFPAYEMLIDDLRDYRFYADDLCHPSSQGVDYVWQRFLEMMVSARDRDVIADAQRCVRRLAHRPLIADAPGVEREREAARREMEEFLRSHPSLRF